MTNPIPIKVFDVTVRMFQVRKDLKIRWGNLYDAKMKQLTTAIARMAANKMPEQDPVACAMILASGKDVPPQASMEFIAAAVELAEEPK